MVQVLMSVLDFGAGFGTIEAGHFEFCHFGNGQRLAKSRIGPDPMNRRSEVQ